MQLIKVIILPRPSAAFDIACVDANSQRYYVADRTNGCIDVVNTADDSLAGQIGGFVGSTGKSTTSGPNGVAIVPELNQLWVGDGDSTLKVVDLASHTIIDSINTGGNARVDELTYDARDRIVVAANDAETPPFMTAVSTMDRTIRWKLPFPLARHGLEQPLWDPASGLIYQPVPETEANPGGEIDVIDPVHGRITAVLPLADCNPHGLSLGPDNQLCAGCNNPKNSIILKTDGTIVATIPQVGGSDEVWYNPGDNRYYLAASGMTADGEKGSTATPVLGIIDAATNSWIANVPTVAGAHSVAADPRTNHVFVMLTNVGIGVYAE